MYLKCMFIRYNSCFLGKVKYCVLLFAGFENSILLSVLSGVAVMSSMLVVFNTGDFGEAMATRQSCNTITEM